MHSAARKFEMTTILSSRAKKIVPASRDHLRSRGTLCYRKTAKFSKVAVCCLLLAAAAIGECVEVEAGGDPSSEHVRITTVVNSKAASGVRVDIYGSENQYKPSVISDHNGVAVLPKLLPGLYGIVAESADRKFHGQLALQVTRSLKNRTSSFFISLTGVLPSWGGLPPVTIGELTAAATMPVSTRLHRFRGILIDQSGAPIPSADIVVMKTRSSDNTGLTISEINSKEDGWFSEPLLEGTYVAVFRMSGFRTEIVAFEVANDGLEDLRVTMRIASC
jgi:Carboxypeptidase regulatory-like domain